MEQTLRGREKIGGLLLVLLVPREVRYLSQLREQHGWGAVTPLRRGPADGKCMSSGEEQRTFAPITEVRFAEFFALKRWTTVISRHQTTLACCAVRGSAGSGRA